MTLFTRAALWINSTLGLVVDHGSMIIGTVIPPLIQWVIAVRAQGYTRQKRFQDEKTNFGGFIGKVLCARNIE